MTAWGASARKLAESTMMKLATARTDPADLINAAIDKLVQSSFELPALIGSAGLPGRPIGRSMPICGRKSAGIWTSKSALNWRH